MINAVLNAMSREDQSALNPILETKWYPYDLYQRLVLTICKVAGRADQSTYTKIGRYSAEHAFATTYQAFLTNNPVDYVKNRIMRMHSLRNDPARMEVFSEKERHCVIKIIEPRSTLEICKIMQSFLARTVELCGARGVRIQESRCSGNGDSYCQYELTWQ